MCYFNVDKNEVTHKWYCDTMTMMVNYDIMSLN